MTDEAPPSWGADEFVELHVQLSRLGETYCRPAGPDRGGCQVLVDCAHAAATRVSDRRAHAPANDTGSITNRLDDYLRRRIAQIESDGVSAKVVVEAGLKLGRPIDEHFIGGVLPAGVHQCAGARMEDGASRYLLALAALAARPRVGSEVRFFVVQEQDAVREYGPLHGPGLETFGVSGGEAAFVRSRDGTEALQVADEVLRSQAAPFLILELRRGSSLADTAVTRRLNLQARRSGAFVFLITPRSERNQRGRDALARRLSRQQSPQTKGRSSRRSARPRS